MISQGESYLKTEHGLFKLGFGKDIISSTYKPVWLYNSSEIGLDNATTCEVFDFSTNAWRYVSTSSAPYRVVGVADPVFVDGSLHWFTDCEETKVLALDLHTEAFHVVSSKAPFPNSHDDPYAIVLCNLDNRLCVSHKKWPDQVIWSFNSGNKTWEKLYSIDLVMTSILYESPSLCAFRPLALLDGLKEKKKNKKKDKLMMKKDKMMKKQKKKKLLFYDSLKSRYLLIHDPETDPDDFTFAAESMGCVVCYFQSLISI